MKKQFLLMSIMFVAVFSLLGSVYVLHLSSARTAFAQEAEVGDNPMAPPTLVCNGPAADFNDGILTGNGWSVVNNVAGLSWSNLASPDCGEAGNWALTGDVACVGSDANNGVPYDTELRTNVIDLSGAAGQTINLGFMTNYDDLTTGAGTDKLDIDISTNGAAGPWTNLLSWDEDHGTPRGTGEAAVVDISAYGGQANVMIRWHNYTPNAAPWDWYAQVDQVSITCFVDVQTALNPAAGLTSTQAVNTVNVMSFDILATSVGDVNWNTDEDPVVIVDAGDMDLPMAPTGAGVSSLVSAPKANYHPPRATEYVMNGRSMPPIWLIPDGSFEVGVPPWYEVSDSPGFGCAGSRIADWSGVWGVPTFDPLQAWWGGGYCGASPINNYVSQTVTIPVADSTLSWWYVSFRPDPDDTNPALYDYAYVRVNGTDVWTLELSTANDTYPNWVQGSVDLSAYVGQTVDLQFIVVSNYDGVTDYTGNIQFDYIGFPPTCTPAPITWVSSSPTSGTVPGGSFETVNVTFDSTGLTPGTTYYGKLCVNSNDLDDPLINLPLTLIIPTNEGTIEGQVELQGRLDWSGAVVEVWDGATFITSGVTDAAGNYSIPNVPVGTYTVRAEMARYLDGEKTNVAVTGGGTTTLNLVRLLGGDTDDNEVVDIFDMSLIGAQFYGTCPGYDARADINDSCAVDVYDYAIAGGNFNKQSVIDIPWP